MNSHTLYQYEDDSDGPSLKEVVSKSCRKVDIGAAVKPKPLSQDGLYPRVLAGEFNSVVVEHHLKWAPLCHSLPGPLADESPTDRLGRYDFHYSDYVVDWALRNDMKVKGHVLVWHVTTPEFVKDFSAQEMKEQIKRHIFTTMGHYKGRIQVWDVVNESLAPDGTLAKNMFLEKLGPGYIEQCFRWAHEADPTATLLYNDNKVEGVGSAKSEGFYKLLAELKRRDVPVHGCGIQAHFNAAGVGLNRPPTPRQVKEQIHRLGQLGLTVNISEMDVRVSKLPPNLRQPAQKQIYHDIIAAALTEPAFDGVWLWGFTDRHTWVTHFYYDDEPLVYDEDYGRKEAFYGLRDAFTTLTVGGTVGGNVPLDSDFDKDGKPWGHLWMQPEPNQTEYKGPVVTAFDGGGGGGGDSRPDWVQETT